MRPQFFDRMPFPDVSGPSHSTGGFFGQPHLPVLVTVQRDITPPVFFGGGKLHRMRVMIVERDQSIPMVDLDTDDIEEGKVAEVLPPMSAHLTPVQHYRLRPRLIEGEILRGENGGFYERLGLHIRPLGRLVCGPSGEVLEVAESMDTLRMPRRGVEVHQDTGSDVVSAEVDQAGEVEEEPQVKTHQTKTPVSYRWLFPEPGQWRVLRLFDFRTELVPQLAHPERLSDSHRLPCYVQVYEATAPVTVEALTEAVGRQTGSQVVLQVLTHERVLQLHLTPFLRPPKAQKYLVRRDQEFLLPGDRVFRLQVALDPTADRTDVADPTPGTRESHGMPVTPEQLQSVLSPETTPTRKTTIPEKFLSPWEFRLSRDEALYDLQKGSSFLTSITRLFRYTFRLGSGFRKWQLLLVGKSADDQLWATRPPRGSLRHPYIREWVRRTLDLAGYDTDLMTGEWEIYWHRKGV